MKGTYVFIAAICFLAASGCSSQLETYPVKGMVEFENGRPVVLGTVEFLSLDHKLNASGTIQEDGTFELTTFEEGDGAVAGKHKCVVIQMVIGEDITRRHRASTVGVVDPRYGSYDTSGLNATINEGLNEIKLVVRGMKRQPAAGESHSH